MTAVVAHDALRQAGGPRRVEDVQRVGGRHRYASDRLAASMRGTRPLDVPSRRIRSPDLRTLEHHAAIAACPSSSSSARSTSGLYGVTPPVAMPHEAHTTTPRSRVVDPGGQLVGAEPAEHDRVDGPEAGAREHRDHRLGNHRHVDDHAIPSRTPSPRSAPASRRDLVEELAVDVAPYGARHRAVVNQRRLFAAPVSHVAIDRVEAGVELAHPETTPGSVSSTGRGSIGRAIPIDRVLAARQNPSGSCRQYP